MNRIILFSLVGIVVSVVLVVAIRLSEPRVTEDTTIIDGTNLIEPPSHSVASSTVTKPKGNDVGATSSRQTLLCSLDTRLWKIANCPDRGIQIKYPESWFAAGCSAFSPVPFGAPALTWEVIKLDNGHFEDTLWFRDFVSLYPYERKEVEVSGFPATSYRVERIAEGPQGQDRAKVVDQSVVVETSAGTYQIEGEMSGLEKTFDCFVDSFKLST